MLITITSAAGDVRTFEVRSADEAKKHLDRYAARRGWRFSYFRVDARNWEGKFVTADDRNIAARAVEATYTITK